MMFMMMSGGTALIVVTSAFFGWPVLSSTDMLGMRGVSIFLANAAVAALAWSIPENK